MIRHKDSISYITQKYYSHKVQLGGDYQHPIKGLGETFNKLKSRKITKMKEVLYVPGFKTNLLSISALDKKGFRVSFVYGEVLMWSKEKTIDDSSVIGIE